MDKASRARQLGRLLVSPLFTQKPVPVGTLRANQRVGRNDPCPCGSGKKFKRCCLNRQLPRLALPYVQPVPKGATGTPVPSEQTGTLAGIELSAAQLRQAGVPPEYVHAFVKTGRFIIPSLRDRYDAATLQAWDEAVEEGRQLAGVAAEAQPTNEEHPQSDSVAAPRSEDADAGQ